MSPDYPPREDEQAFHYQMLEKLAADSQMNANKMREFYGYMMRCRYYGHLPDGDIVECGVWRGASAAILGRVFANTGRQVHLFDSFAGMPAPTEQDKMNGDKSVPGRVAGDGGSFGQGSLSDTSIDHVHRVMKIAGVTGYHIHKGFIRTAVDLLPAPNKIAILHVDLDFYDPYKVVLEALYNSVVPGGVIIFDDYGYFIGAKRAVDEFCARTGEALMDTDGTSRRVVVKGGR